MMNTDGTTGGNNMGLGQADDQQMITPNDRENYIHRLTMHFNGDQNLAKYFDDQAIVRSGGKAILYKKALQMLIQERNQQIQQQQQQQQQQQSMMASQQQQQQQQQSMYMQAQQATMVRMPQQQQQQQASPAYAMQAPLQSSMAPTTPMMNIKQEPQAPMSNMQMRQNPQNFPMQQQQQQAQQQQQQLQQQQQQQLQQQQQQQQIKQELMVPPMSQQQQQQQIKQELMVPSIQQQQTGMSVQQMRQQQQPPMQYNQQQSQPPPQSLPNQPATNASQQRNLVVQQLQQVRQQNHLNQQQQQESNSLQMQQQQTSNSSTLSQPPSAPTTSASGSSDEILQQLLTSPNPPKQSPTAAQNAVQARLRTINRNVRNPAPQQQPSPMTPGSDPMMVGNVPSPHSHPGMMQQPQTPIGAPGQSPLARYMMAQSPQTSLYRPQMSPMNMMNYAGSPQTMIDEEMHYLFKYFTERMHQITRIITRCQQEGQHDRVPKYRQIHDQMAAFVRNPMPEHIMVARRLKDHVDRLFDPRMSGPAMMPQMVDMSGMMPPGSNTGRLMTNGIFEQCQRATVDFLGKDNTLKYNVAKRFLEPLSEVLNGVPHKNMRLDTESKQSVETYSSQPTSQSLASLVNIIESEFALLSMNTFTYELKPWSDKMSTSSSSSSVIDTKDLPDRDYELTCRFIEINMPVVPPLKMKLTVKYPTEPPEVLSLTSTTLSLTPAKLENSDGHSFFETISRNFIYFLFKLPAQHTVTDILDIWRTAIRNASLTQQES